MSAAALDTSRERLLRTAADGGVVLAHATAVRAVASTRSRDRSRAVLLIAPPSP